MPASRARSVIITPRTSFRFNSAGVERVAAICFHLKKHKRAPRSQSKSAHKDSERSCRKENGDPESAVDRPQASSIVHSRLRLSARDGEGKEDDACLMRFFFQHIR